VAGIEAFRRALPIVFGPRTLVRTWGTRTEGWDLRQIEGEGCGIPHLAKNERDMGSGMGGGDRAQTKGRGDNAG
jgi:hypothetical protein